MADCAHDTPETFGVCAHLLAKPESYLVRFTGDAKRHDRLCDACADGATPDLHQVCAACRDTASTEGASGYRGTPGITIEPSTLHFEHVRREPLPHAAVVDIRPVLAGDRDVWIALTGDAELVRLDLDRRTLAPLARIPTSLFDRTDETREQPLRLHLSRDARLAAVVQRKGQRGVVLDLETGRELMALSRGDSHEEHCEYSCAFFDRGGRTLLAHATAWNRLDVVDPRTGEQVTARESPVYSRDQRPEHYLDYFHCGLLVSPDDTYVAEHGWIWHPYGVVTAWSLDAWVGGNVWESEDGPTRRSLASAGYFWDGPMCWLDNQRLATWGLGDDDPLLDAVRIWDVPGDRELDWFPGPSGDLVYDGGVLIALAGERGTTAWNLERGTRLVHDARVAPMRYHPTAKTFVSFGIDPALLTSRLCGHQARWNEGVIAELVKRIASERAFGDLPVLGDALEGAGCTDAELLAHCQAPGEHGDRCWAIDRLLRQT